MSIAPELVPVLLSAVEIEILVTENLRMARMARDFGHIRESEMLTNRALELQIKCPWRNRNEQ